MLLYLAAVEFKRVYGALTDVHSLDVICSLVFFAVPVVFIVRLNIRQELEVSHESGSLFSLEKIQRLRKPSLLMGIADGRLCLPGYTNNFGALGTTADYEGVGEEVRYRHNGKINVTYMDMHAAPKYLIGDNYLSDLEFFGRNQEPYSVLID